MNIKKTVAAMTMTTVFLCNSMVTYAYVPSGPGVALYQNAGFQDNVVISEDTINSIHQEILSRVNSERSKVGSGLLSYNDSLQQAANQRAKEIVTTFDHKRPDGTSCFTVSELSHGENIAAGHKSSEIVMNAWVNSAGHYKNIVNSNFKSMAVGYYEDSNGRKYWVQLFSYFE